MILVDANLLIYAEDGLSPKNATAREWWDEALSGAEPVCLCWPVLSAFLRLSTNPRVFDRPLSLEEASDRVQSWLDQPCTRLIQPTQRHWAVFRDQLQRGKASANLVSDARAPWPLWRSSTGARCTPPIETSRGFLGSSG